MDFFSNLKSYIFQNVINLIIMGLCLGLLGLEVYDRYFATDETAEIKTLESIEEVAEEKMSTTIKVDIKGEVNAPGVYEVSTDNNVFDLITLAGGLTKKGTTKNINLAKRLEAEMVVIISSTTDLKKTTEVKTIIKCPEVDLTKCPANNGNSNTGKISINTADLNTLMTLPGIGESKAKSIIAYREEKGLFKDIQEIMNVSGIGESIFAQIKDNITI